MLSLTIDTEPLRPGESRIVLDGMLKGVDLKDQRYKQECLTRWAD